MKIWTRDDLLAYRQLSGNRLISLAELVPPGDLYETCGTYYLRLNVLYQPELGESIAMPYPYWKAVPSEAVREILDLEYLRDSYGTDVQVFEWQALGDLIAASGLPCEALQVLLRGGSRERAA